MLGIRGDVYWFEVMACAGMAVHEAWCVSSRGEGDWSRRCGGESMGWVLGDGCWVSLAMDVGAIVGPCGDVQVMTWDDMSVCGMQCVAYGVRRDGVQLRGGGPAALSYSSARITPAPVDMFKCMPAWCVSLCFPFLVPCVCVCACLEVCVGSTL